MAYPVQKTFAIAILAFLLVGCQRAPAPETNQTNTQSPLPTFLQSDAITSPLVNKVSEDGTVNVVVNEAPKGDSGIAMPSPSANPSVTKAPENLLYKDGSASFTAHYTSPAGEESFDIVIAVAKDMITGVKVDPKATEEVSQKFQSAFANGIDGAIVGKKLNEISDLSRIAGASLTTTAFNAKIAEMQKHFKK